MLIKTFEEQVEKFPQKTAIETIDRVLSYSELNMYANRTARQLISHNHGVSEGGEHPMAALLFEHGADMIIGLLGALKADHIYVPMDAAYPEKRLQYLLEHSGAGVILTNSKNLALAESLAVKMNKTGDLSIVNVDACTGDNRIPVDNIPRQPLGEKLAYILYTSGSTGKPKGVLQCHGNILYFIRNWTRRFSISGSDRITLFSALSHDGAIPDIYSALLNGAALYPRNIKEEVNTANLADWLVDKEITLWHSVPTLFRFFVNSLRERGRNHHDFPGLRLIVLGGEAVIEHDVTTFKQFFPHSTLANIYGQTESTVNSIWMVGADEPWERVLIGEPIDQTELMIMDEDGDIVEDFGVGEILVVSDHAALGYWRDNGAGKKVFLDDPDLGRLYRTGDIGRLISEGEIEFLGRADNQVKIRGFRVEPGEIETALLTHESVKEAVVIDRETQEGEVCLCAYIVAVEAGASLETMELRNYLLDILPDYMVPAQFVQLAEMPLTPSNKVDREALPDPGTARAASIAPRDKIEKKLAEIWGEVLAGATLADIGIDDNYFELGGHSLKAARIVSKIHKALEVEVPLTVFFEAPTIRDLSQYIKKKAKTPYAAIEAVEKKEYYPLTSNQKRLYFLQLMEEEGINYNQAQAFVLEAELNLQRLEEVCQALTRRHESLRTSFEIIHDEPVQRICENPHLEIACYRCDSEYEAHRLIHEFIRPFDLTKPPLIRFGIIKIGKEKHIFMWDVHHITTDGTSMVVLINEFMICFAGSQLPELRLQYKDYAEWQNSTDLQKIIQRQEKYWLKQFEDDVAPLDLPLDFPRPPLRSFEGAEVSFEISPDQTAALNRLALEKGATLYMVLFAVFNIFLFKLTGREDIVVGTSLAARRHANLENIIGMFVNNLPIRNYPRESQTFSDFLEEVRKNTLGAFENQDYPFEYLVERLYVRRDTNRNPLFDVLFALQNIEAPSTILPTVQIPGLKVTPYKTEIRASKFDIHLTCVETNKKIFGTFEYCTKLFKPETIEMFVKYYKKVISEITRNPGIKLSGIEIVSGDERSPTVHESDNGSLDQEYRQGILLTSKFMKQKAFWLKRLSVETEKTQLPFRRLKSINRPGDREIEKIEIPITDELFVRLMILAKQSDLSLYIILLTALILLLHRYTNHEEAVVASPVYKENVTPQTLNHRLFVRGFIEGEGTFLDQLFQTRKTLLEAYENQDYPSDKLLEYLFDSSQNGSAAGGDLSDIVCLLVNIHDNKICEQVKEQVIFSFERGESGLEGHILFDGMVYEKAYMGLICKHFTVLLQQAALDVKVKIPGILFSSTQEERRLLEEFNQTCAEYPREKTLAELFREQAEQTPGHVALVAQSAGRCAVTYKELDEKSNRLAVYLKEKGVLPDTIVPVMAGRSIEIIIGILGILKAGAAYLPIDPDYPRERIDYMLADSGARLLLTTRSLAEEDRKSGKWENQKNLERIFLELPLFANSPAASLPRFPVCNSSNLAYVIYTSGTSGRPRGVMVNHGSIVNYTWWASQTYLSGKPAAFPFFTSISFDLTLTSLFTPLLTGNTIVVYSEEEPTLLLERIIDDRLVDIVKLTPSHLTLLKHREEDIAGCGIKGIIVGGEKLGTDLALEIHKKFKGNAAIYNEYGPTEAAVGCMIYRFDPGSDNSSSVPIGYPINNTHIYILDRYFRPLPVGAAGELCIGGDGVARGYLNHPELTAERFRRIELTTGEYKRERIYTTGDLARIFTDGNVEFLGRIDSQIKIRGFRVEPREIESHLGNYPGIREAVVLAGGNNDLDKYLCAYIVSDQAPDIPGIRQYLEKSLPGYMIPAYLVPVDKIPLTGNGKIDHRSLPALEVKVGNVRTAPRNTLEKKLAGIYAEVLGVEAKKIDIDANFFHLGGHSVKATVLAARIHRQLKVKLPLVEMFKRTTIRTLAQYIKEIGQGEYASIEPVEKKEYYPLSPAQKRMYILQQMDLQHTAYNQPGLYEFVEPPEMEKLQHAFKKLIQRHAVLRTVFQVIEEEPVQIVYREVRFTIEYVKTTKKELRKVFEVFNRSFDLEQPPLLRVGVVNIENSRYLLMVDTHHIVSDFVSKMILIRDFLSIYYDRDLVLMRLQYKDFAQWQNRPEQRQALKKQEKYWLKQFAGDIPVFDLPTDYPRPAVQGFEGDKFSFRLEKEITAKLNALAVERGVTPYMLLLCLYNILLYKLSGQECFVVGTDISLRTHADLQKIVGMFVNTMALKFYPAGTKTFETFLEEIKKRTWEAFENRDYPFEKLVEQMAKERDLSRNPLFDTAFFFNNVTGNPVPGDVETEMGTDNPPLLVQTRYQKEKETTMFDLSLWVVETKDYLFFTFEYCTKLFRKEKIEAFATFYREIAAAVLETPHITLGEIEISLLLLAGKREEIALDELDF